MIRSFFSCVAVWLGFAASAATAADPLPTVPHVDLARYAGTWHEVARLPNWFQRSCERSRAEYTPCGEGEPEAPYEWAMVGTPDRRFLWILARQPCLPPEVLAQLQAQARCLGFDVASMVRPN